ncbi:MAG: 16S rRNA processing protein RimM [Clostridia bacterium]|nr:16S rRNA processing protein RimM [Clostridia bacterium]
MLNKYLECGQIVRSHGINGGMIVNHLCDSYEVFANLKHLYLKIGSEYKELNVKKCSQYKNAALVLTSEILNPEDVTKLRGQSLYAKREEISKDEDSFFIVDLIGLEVRDADTNELYGTLKDVINQGAQDIYVVTLENGAEALIPAVQPFLDRISLEEGIFIKPIEGMI